MGIVNATTRTVLHMANIPARPDRYIIKCRECHRFKINGKWVSENFSKIKHVVEITCLECSGKK
jgi:hypothetical protein